LEAEENLKARLVGIISDTHGLLRSEAVAALRGVELIIHAGDVGKEELLARLEEIAPVIAVRGNVDTDAWAARLPLTAVAEVGEQKVWVLHNIAHLDLDPAAGGFGMVIYGHSHHPAQQIKDGVIYLNPGSAGPRRFYLPVSVVIADFGVDPPEIRFIDLERGRDFVP
jgi:uncharacterized protein